VGNKDVFHVYSGESCFEALLNSVWIAKVGLQFLHATAKHCLRAAPDASS